MPCSNTAFERARLRTLTEQIARNQIKESGEQPNPPVQFYGTGEDLTPKEVVRYMRALTDVLPLRLSTARSRYATLHSQLQSVRAEKAKVQASAQELRALQENQARYKAEARTHQDKNGSALMKALGWGTGSVLVASTDIPLAVASLVMKIDPSSDPLLPTITVWGAAIAITLVQLLILETMVLKPAPEGQERGFDYYIRVTLGVIGILAISTGLAYMRRDAMGDGTASDWLLLAITAVSYPAFGIFSALMLHKARESYELASAVLPDLQRVHQQCREGNGKLRLRSKSIRVSRKVEQKELVLLARIAALEAKSVKEVFKDPVVLQLMEAALNDSLASRRAFQNLIGKENEE